jgi:hypothetical protein
MRTDSQIEMAITNDTQSNRDQSRPLPGFARALLNLVPSREIADNLVNSGGKYLRTP